MRTTKKRILMEEVQAAIEHQSTKSPEIPEPIHFKCRICGSEKYEGVYTRTGFETIGGTIYPTAYKCNGCSIVFGDPILFTKK